MEETASNRWAGKSAEDILVESYHEIRDPIYNVVGFLNVLKSTDQLSLSAEQIQQYIGAALHNALSAKIIVDSVYEYMHKTREDS